MPEHHAGTAGPPDRRDTITLTGLRAHGHHGVFDHERRDGQPFVVDLVLYTDIRAAARGDDLRETIHYGYVAQTVHDTITSDPVDLIETLAERIAAAVLEGYDVSAVDVTVHKPQAPIEVAFTDVTIGIHRERA